jgi:hypothetical protein
MIKVTYNAWGRYDKDASSNSGTLEELDLLNKTHFFSEGDSVSILEKASRYAHEKRKVYFVTIYKNDNPINFLEVNNDFFGVGFLDEFKREYMSYTFSEVESGKLFLKEVAYWEFSGDTDKVLKSTFYKFTEEGELVIEKTDEITFESKIQTAQDKIDVLGNYEDYPEFGAYEAIINKERLSN